MLEDLDTIVASARVLINETTEGFWLDTEMEDWANEGMENIGHETFCMRTYKTYTILTDDIFDERELRFDEDHIAIDEGKIYYNDVCCYPTTQARLSHYDSEWRSRTGTPSEYYVRGDMYGFNQKISAGDTIKYYHIERAETLSGTTVTPFNGDYRLINFRTLIRNYVIAMCWEKKANDVKSDKWMARYDRGLIKMKELLGIDLDNVSAIIPEESLSHFSVEAKWPNWL